MKTAQEYKDSLRERKIRVYVKGQLLDSREVIDHPFIRGHVNSAAMTYALAGNPEYADLMTTTSHLTGHKINRFTHIHQSVDDLMKKAKMLRTISQKTGTCYQRCVGFDAMNATYTVTYECDKALGTNYHERFKKFLIQVQDNDWMVAGAMTDVKGDRSLRPGQQVDPDMFVHVVEKREDGIVIRGAKGPHDRYGQLPLDADHAHHGHAGERGPVRRLLRDPRGRPRRDPHLRPSDQR